MIKAMLMGLFILPLTLNAKRLELNSQENFQRLLREMDSDADKKITIDDKSSKENRPFSLRLKNAQTLMIKTTYLKSNLLQELKLALDAKRNWVDDQRLYENVVDRISRNIKDHYWDHLTRRIDNKTLPQVLVDSKIQQGPNRYLYVPEKDSATLKYFQAAKHKNVIIATVPAVIDEKFLQSLKGQHGLLTLKIGVPFVVPGGRFNEMYGWDSYFEALGLIQDERVDLARGMIDNMVYEIEYYGKILNANRTYYLARSQPPFLTSMIRSVLAKLPRDQQTKEWLKTALKAAIKEYQTVWMGPEHLTPIGLSRYYGYSPEIPPEVEPGHFTEVLSKLKKNELKKFLINDQAVRESGHDTTYRWFKKGVESCSDFVTVDLNSLLYKVELDLAYLIQHEFKGKFENLTTLEMYQKAEHRKMLIRKYLWHEAGGFYDFDWKTHTPSRYVSATGLYPLWAHEPTIASTKILNAQEAEKLLTQFLPQLEMAGGLAASAKSSVLNAGGILGKRQWDYPNGWAPHQMLAWQGLALYGYQAHADRLISKWLKMIIQNALNYNGTIPEKYDVVARSHAVFAEYGNVGTKFSYITQEGFGWMNASYQVGLQMLTPASSENLYEEFAAAPK